jgi:GAF domain-containing protein
MELLTARFVDQLFSSPSEIMVMDQLAEWNRQHLDARYASAQTYNPSTKSLRVVAHREFAPGLMDQFGDMPIATSSTVCARAASSRSAILIPDVTEDKDWTPYLSFSEAAGIGGVLSIPLLSKAGDLLGVTSCHFASQARPTAKELNFVRVSCEFAADAIAELRWRNGHMDGTGQGG